MSTDPLKDLEQQALAKLNQDKSWLRANKAWFIAIAAAAIAGFIVAKIL